MAAALAGAAILAVAPAAHGAGRAVTTDGWAPKVMAFADGTLVWSEAAPVRIDPRRVPDAPAGAQPFTYYRAEAFRAPLARGSRRFAGGAETLISIRESIAAMAPGSFAAVPGGGAVMAPWSPAFAAPVVRCCSPDGQPVELASDGRPDAPRALAVGWDGVARWVELAAGGAQVLRREGEAAGVATAERTAPGLVALAAGRRAWVDPLARRLLHLGQAGTPGTARRVPLPAPALRVWGAPGIVAVAVRSGRRVTLLRVGSGAPAPVWSGTRLPRVALGGGAVAVADGRRVLAARRGPLRPVRVSPRPVDGVGVDGARLAWAERGLRRGVRIGLLRLAGTP